VERVLTRDLIRYLRNTRDFFAGLGDIETPTFLHKSLNFIFFHILLPECYSFHREAPMFHYLSFLNNSNILHLRRNQYTTIVLGQSFQWHVYIHETPSW